MLYISLLSSRSFSLSGEFSVEHRFDPRIFNTNRYVLSIFNQMKKSHSPASFGDDHLCSDIMKFRPQISLVQINFDVLHTLRQERRKRSKLLICSLFIYATFFSLNMVTNANNIITLYLNKELVLGCRCFF